MGPVLWLAALYNFAWGAWVVLFPDSIFELTGARSPEYPQIWQCVGMIVGVYGVGYAIAASNPLRHWPIVLVGFLGKVLGPIGFVGALADGVFPLAFGWTIVTNDLIWWIPFGAILLAAARSASEERSRVVDDESSEPSVDLAQVRTNEGRSLEETSRDRPALVVFLRHAGCTFCREALSDVAARREELERRGTTIVLVHMSDDSSARDFFRGYGLDDLPRISDPDRSLYRAFGLSRGRLVQLFGPYVWYRGLIAAIAGHGLGALAGDGFQMPGAFLVHRGRIVRAFRHQSAADRPDYDAIACGIA